MIKKWGRSKNYIISNKSNELLGFVVKSGILYIGSVTMAGSRTVLEQISAYLCAVNTVYQLTSSNFPC